MLACADQAGRFDARQHALIAYPLDRVRRSLARVLDARIDQVAHRIEHVQNQVLLERRNAIPLRAQVQRQEADVECAQLE